VAAGLRDLPGHRSDMDRRMSAPQSAGGVPCSATTDPVRGDADTPPDTNHSRVDWYTECRAHPMPQPPDGLYDPAHDAVYEAEDAWLETHFMVGDDDDFWACEDTRVDACRECSEANDREFVPWHEVQP